MLFEIPQAVPHFTDNNTKVQGGLVTSSSSLFYLCRSEVRSISCVRLFVTPWTVAYQAFPSMGFSRREYWSGVPLPSPMINLDSILKSRDITLPTKICLVKAMVFPGVMYGYESWTIKKAEHQRIAAFELWCWRRLLRVPGLQGDPISLS